MAASTTQPSSVSCQSLSVPLSATADRILASQGVNRPKLPAPGSVLRYVPAAVPVVRGGDPEVFAALLRSLLARLAAEPHDFLLVGLHENDPLLPTARTFSVNAYVTGRYLACWEDGEPLCAELDARPPYLELGCL